MLNISKYIAFPLMFFVLSSQAFAQKGDILKSKGLDEPLFIPKWEKGMWWIVEVKSWTIEGPQEIKGIPRPHWEITKFRFEVLSTPQEGIGYYKVRVRKENVSYSEDEYLYLLKFSPDDLSLKEFKNNTQTSYKVNSYIFDSQCIIPLAGEVPLDWPDFRELEKAKKSKDILYSSCKKIKVDQNTRVLFDENSGLWKAEIELIDRTGTKRQQIWYSNNNIWWSKLIIPRKEGELGIWSAILIKSSVE